MSRRREDEWIGTWRKGWWPILDQTWSSIGISIFRLTRRVIMMSWSSWLKLVINTERIFSSFRALGHSVGIKGSHSIVFIQLKWNGINLEESRQKNRGQKNKLVDSEIALFWYSDCVAGSIAHSFGRAADADSDNRPSSPPRGKDIGCGLYICVVAHILITFGRCWLRQSTIFSSSRQGYKINEIKVTQSQYVKEGLAPCRTSVDLGASRDPEFRSFHFLNCIPGTSDRSGKRG